MSTLIKAGTATSGAVVEADATGQIELQTGSTPTTAVTIDSSRNVGIGTSSPSAVLDVVTSSGANGISLRGRSSDSISDISLKSNDGATVYGQIQGRSTDTRIQSNSTLPLLLFTNSSERMRIDSSGNVGIGTSSVTSGAKFQVDNPNANVILSVGKDIPVSLFSRFNDDPALYWKAGQALRFAHTTDGVGVGSFTERMRITSGGFVLIGGTSDNPVATNVNGISFEGSFGSGKFSRGENAALDVNRRTNDGELVRLYQDGTQEGSISVSGTTVSYNGGHLSRYAQTVGAKDESLLKGTILSNLDEMNIYVDKDGNQVDNEQLNKVKVSDVEGDVNVAGVFVNWSFDEKHNVDEINMAMTGDMIIRIAEGVVVQKGDLLMSAGDGTAKPQDDDIVRSKTIAKVTSNHVTCTYEDGSYCVPCVLMAC